MGFWSSLGSFAVKAAEFGVGAAIAGAKGISDFGKEAEELSAKWQSQSDESLVRKYKNGSFTEKAAAAKVLTSRYPDEEERKMVVAAIYRKL